MQENAGAGDVSSTFPVRDLVLGRPNQLQVRRRRRRPLFYLDTSRQDQMIGIESRFSQRVTVAEKRLAGYR